MAVQSGGGGRSKMDVSLDGAVHVRHGADQIPKTVNVKMLHKSCGGEHSIMAIPATVAYQAVAGVISSSEPWEANSSAVTQVKPVGPGYKVGAATGCQNPLSKHPYATFPQTNILLGFIALTQTPEE